MISKNYRVHLLEALKLAEESNANALKLIILLHLSKLYAHTNAQQSDKMKQTAIQFAHQLSLKNVIESLSINLG